MKINNFNDVMQKCFHPPVKKEKTIIYNVLYKGFKVSDCYVVAFESYQNACDYAESRIKEKGLKCLSSWGTCDFGTPDDYRCIDENREGDDDVYYVIFKQEVRQ